MIYYGQIDLEPPASLTFPEIIRLGLKVPTVSSSWSLMFWSLSVVVPKLPLMIVVRTP